MPEYPVSWAGLRGGENLSSRGLSGKTRRIRMACKRSFSERKEIVLEHSLLPEEKTHTILNHFREGCETHGTGRLAEVVTHYLALVGLRQINSTTNSWLFPTDP